ncbi:hypothetical protein OB920_08965 [Halobacteria archaeon HArc-gm2]|nr:hypothetical protein [Halobacteria archaeon HArc-gm2]
MLNSIQSLSNPSGTSAAGSDATAALDPLLQDGETVRYVLTSSKGIEQTQDGRTTTVQPGSSHDAYAIVTDFRVLFLVGSDAEEPSIDIEFDLPMVASSKARNSLLSSSLVVASEEKTTVKFTPSGGPDVEEVAEYIDRLSDCWADFHRAIAATREAIDAFEATLTAGEDAQEELTTAQSRLSNAHHHATRNEDGPVEAMLEILEPVEDELDQLQVEARLDRVDDLLADAEAEDAFDDAVAALVEARDRLEEARGALDEEALAGEGAAESIDERTAAIDDYATSLLADAEDACHQALDAADADAAAKAWETALARYRTVRDADWDELGGVDEDALDFQIAWVVGNRIDALCARGAELETEGDDLDDSGDDATERFEAAKDAVETAQTLADEHPHTDADRFDERLEDLQEKVEVSEWQWGDA